MLHYVYRLKNDYDVMKCLGKGGFGVVYHVRNKVDRQEYAVKIIKLPSRWSCFAIVNCCQRVLSVYQCYHSENLTRRR